ncbi:parallel beta helix pectate lyase-like protein [Streptomyces sp. TLI_235]|nr:PKD domain-containing protein [Streptomyces sp. TLI_235]PBC78756.1 parallel beta helix pectate lyase-like protein [Streptomyces sp. TLI_235]
MRIPRAVGAATAVLTAALGLQIPAAAADGGTTTLYVWQGNAACSDTGPGTRARPFCSVQPAVDAARPGTTVQLQQDSFFEDVRITRSGTADAPITILGASSRLAGTSTKPGPALAVSGAEHLVLRDLSVDSATVENSADITLDQVRTSSASVSLEIGGGNHGVAVTRGRIMGRIRVSGGSTGVVISNNVLSAATATPLSVSGTPGATVTNNTVTLGCGPGIALLDGSSGARVFNNIVDGHRATTADGRPCAEPATAAELLVSADSATDTVADYNLVRAADGGTPYSWAGSAYATPESLHAATGQGGHDLLTDPKVTSSWSGALTDCTAADPGVCSPAIDSALADAPGVLGTDIDGHTPADHPYVTDGPGGHLDRGAAEVVDTPYSVKLTPDHMWAPYGTPVTFTAEARSKWPTTLRYTFDFGDGHTQTTDAPKATHTYVADCTCRPKVTATGLGGASVSAGTYDSGFRVSTPGPLDPQLTTADVRPVNTDFSAAQPLTVSADAALSVTSSPWPVKEITFDFGDGSWKGGSLSGKENHTYAAPGDYTVTVTMTDSQGRTASASRVHRAHYLDGRYTPVTPYRLLDTRSQQFKPNPYVPLTLDLSSYGPTGNHGLSAGMTAVVLNVTATNAEADTFLTLWPSGQPRPTASNLNVKAGQTVANLVTVPVGRWQQVDVHNHSGDADVIVDVLGYYQPDWGSRFSPTAPARLLDTRQANGRPDSRFTQDEARGIQVTGQAGVPASARAVVLNLTATASTTGGYLAAYPHGGSRPNVSSLNFTAGQTVANQAIVPIGRDGQIDLYNFRGDTQVIADVVGYYGDDGTAVFVPVPPTRLADTRQHGGALGPAGETAVQIGGANGVPADAVAGVLNVTATQPTAAGFLTVWPDGSPRPGTSSLNFLPGQTVPNHVTAPLGGNGRFRVYNHAGNTQVIADLSGYFVKG